MTTEYPLCPSFTPAQVSTGFEGIEYFRGEIQLAATIIIVGTMMISQIWLGLLFLPIPQLPQFMKKLDIELNFEEILERKKSQLSEEDSLLGEEENGKIEKENPKPLLIIYKRGCCLKNYPRVIELENLSGVTSKCPLCPGKETVNHRIITCDYTADITRQFRTFWHTSTNKNLPEDFNLMNAHNIKQRQQLLINLYSIVLYSIWIVRNNKVFNNNLVPISQIIERELRRFYAKISFRAKLSISQTQNTQKLSIIDNTRRKWSNTMFDFDQDANVIVQYSFNWQ